MAAALSTGGQSPTSLSRTLEKVLEDAQHTGEIQLSGRKLKDYPKISGRYDLADSTKADLSKNRFGEIPPEVCDLEALETINLYHNVLRCIPQAIVQLQSLVHLNLSRNQLSTIPPFLCQLQCLEVLLAANNKLVSLPEEVGRLTRLMDMDVSCNEITHLPSQIGDLDSLRTLNLRRNLLTTLPPEMSQLHLKRLDLSSNKVSSVPFEFRTMDTIEDIRLENNPLVCPPPQVCSKGRVHIMKYLRSEALKEDRKRGVIHSEMEVNKGYRKSHTASQPTMQTDDLRGVYNDVIASPLTENNIRKRRTVDSGYCSTADSSSTVWSPENSTTNEVAPGSQGYEDPSNQRLAVRAGENAREHREQQQHQQQHYHHQQQQQPHFLSSPLATTPAVSSNGAAYVSPNAISPQSSNIRVVRRMPAGSSPSSAAQNVPQSPEILTATAPAAASSPRILTPDSNNRVAAPPMNGSRVQQQQQPANGDPRRPTNGDPHGPTNGGGGHHHHPHQQQQQHHHGLPPNRSPESPRVQIDDDDTPDDLDDIDSREGMVDEFTRELQRQKAAYEQKKKMAEQVRREMEQQEVDRSPRQQEVDRVPRQQEVVRSPRQQEVDRLLRQQEVDSRSLRQQEVDRRSPRQQQEVDSRSLRQQEVDNRSLRQQQEVDNRSLRQQQEVDRSPPLKLSWKPSNEQQEEENDEEAEQTRRAARRIQEEQKAVMEGRRKTPSTNADSITSSSSSSSVTSYSETVESVSTKDRRLPHSHSFKEERLSSAGGGGQQQQQQQQAPAFRRAVSECGPQGAGGAAGEPAGHSPGPHAHPPQAAAAAGEYWQHARNNGVHDSSFSSESGLMDTSFNSQHSSGSLPPAEEFRNRHEAMLQQQRYEAAMVRKRLQDEKNRLRSIQKEAVYGYMTSRQPHLSSSSDPPSSPDSTFSRDSTPNTSFNGEPPQGPDVRQVPVQYQKALDKLEAMSSELNSVNPGFTVRRQFQHAKEERDSMERLRSILESRLKVKLPDDLTAALRDGVVLCHLANHIRPRSVSSIHVPSPSVPKLSMAKCRRNVENFLEACRRMGIPEAHLCPTAMILEEKNVVGMTRMVEALLSHSKKPQLSAV